MAILVVEDERELSDLLCFLLRRAGYDVIMAYDGESALNLWREHRPELVLLDIGLPRGSGWDVCRTITAECRTPVMIISGADAEDDIVHGFEVGAADYVVKPFSPRIVQARVRTLLKRSAEGTHAGDADSCARIADLSMDTRLRTLSCAERQVRLTRLQLRVLHELSLHYGQVVEHPDLIQKVWGYKGEGTSDMVKGHIRSVRLKLEELGSAATIRIIPGVGYIMEARTAPQSAEVDRPQPNRYLRVAASSSPEQYRDNHLQPRQARQAR